MHRACSAVRRPPDPGPPTGPPRTFADAFTRRQSLKLVVRLLRKHPLTAGGHSVCQDQLPVRMMSLLLSRAVGFEAGRACRVSGPAAGAHDAALLSWTSMVKSGVK